MQGQAIRPLSAAHTSNGQSVTTVALYETMPIWRTELHKMLTGAGFIVQTECPDVAIIDECLVPLIGLGNVPTMVLSTTKATSVRFNAATVSRQTEGTEIVRILNFLAEQAAKMKEFAVTG